MEPPLKLFTYAIAPIDFYWEFLVKVEDHAAMLAAAEAREQVKGVQEEFARDGLAGFLAAWDDAQQAARQAGWEGDFAQSPRVFWLPTTDHEFSFGFVVKQDNNGTTFVMSPVPLPHLAY